MEHLVSIVIPTFNREKLIISTIKNLQGQTYANWECIIVDDHSTDNTKSVIGELAEKDRRIRYVLNERSKGAQGARNTGILHAIGEWIAFNDSDDEWMPDKLEKQMAVISQKDYNTGLVVHGNCIVNDHVQHKTYEWQMPVAEGTQLFPLLLKKASPLFPSIITSKTALEDAGLLDEKVPSYQEWDTSIRLARKCEFVHMKEPLFIYHLHKGETISKDIRRDISGYQYIRLKYAREFEEHFGEQSLSYSLINNVKRIADDGYWKLGLDLLKEAKRYIPARQYWYLASCFTFHIHPDKDLKYLHKIRKKIS